MFERFSDGARKLMGAARNLALLSGSDWIGSEHIVLACLSDEAFGAVRLLKHLGVDPAKIRAAVEGVIPGGTGKPTLGQMPFSPDSKKLIEGAAAVALELKHADIATGHFLVADLGNPTGVLRQVLPRLEMEPLLLRTRITEVLSKLEWL